MNSRKSLKGIVCFHENVDTMKNTNVTKTFWKPRTTTLHPG